MPESLSLPPWLWIAAAAVATTVLAVWVMRRLAARERARSASAALHGGYLVATAVIAAVALALILVAFTMSYAALYEAATWLEHTQLLAINGGDLRFLFPLGIDAVIVYFLAMDLLMEWQGRRHALNRWAAYALSAITIVLNVSQGDGSTSSYLGHAGPPIVIILIAEGVSAWIRHLAGLAHGQATDRIPVGRWIAHPISTLKVARLMLGWGITSYPQALEREQRRQLAYAMLREQHGRRWRRHAPRHLRWMLNNGYDLDTAYELTRALTVTRVAMTAAEVTALANPSAHGRNAPQTVATVANPVGHSHGSRDTGDSTPDSGVQDTGAGLDINPGHGPDNGAVSKTGPDMPTASAGGNDHRAPTTAAGAEASIPDKTPVADTAEEAPSLALPVAPAQDTPASSSAGDASHQDAPPAPGALSPAQKRERVRELLQSFPAITDTEIAQEINASPRTARRYRNEIGRQDTPEHTPETVSGHDPAPGGADGQGPDSGAVLTAARAGR